jgi:hypothetical protein
MFVAHGCKDYPELAVDVVSEMLLDWDAFREVPAERLVEATVDRDVEAETTVERPVDNAVDFTPEVIAVSAEPVADVEIERFVELNVDCCVRDQTLAFSSAPGCMIQV